VDEAESVDARKAEEEGAAGEMRSVRTKTEFPRRGLAPTDELSAYELERLANIARNEEVLRALELDVSSSALRESARSRPKPTARGVGRPKEKAEHGPIRRSGRHAGLEAEFAGGIVSESADGKVLTLANGDIIGSGKAAFKAANGASEAKERVVEPQLPFRSHVAKDAALEEEWAASTAADEKQTPLQRERAQSLLPEMTGAREAAEKADQAMLELLASATSPAAFRKGSGGLNEGADDGSDENGSGKASKGSKGGSDAGTVWTSGIGLSALEKVHLDESDAVKVTVKATVHLKFQPRGDTLCVAAGDKDGNVSLWHADRASDSASDGVFLCAPHTQYISGLEWSAHDAGVLYTASYDGTVRALHPQKGSWELLYSRTHSEFSAFTLSAPSETTTLWLGSSDGRLSARDTRSPSETLAPVAVHANKVNCLSMCGARPYLLASAGTDRAVRVWDVRKLGAKPKPLAEMLSSNSSQSAEWSPDGRASLLTTHWDDRLRIYDGLGLDTAPAPKAREIKHCTRTGRWVVPFRAVWTPAGDGVVVGAMDRSAVIFNASNGSKANVLRSPEIMTAIPSRNTVHPSLPVVACATNSGRLHLYRA